MAAMKKPQQDRNEIRRLLELRKAEGLSYRALAARTGVPIHVLTHRANRDRQAARSAAAKANAFVEVVAREDLSSSGSGIELHVGQVRVQVMRDFDATTLQRLLTVLPC